MTERYYLLVDPDRDDTFRRVYPDPSGARPFLWKRATGGKTTYPRDAAYKARAAARERFGRTAAMLVRFDDNPFTVFADQHDLDVTSREPATPGVHSPTSYHYRTAPWGGSSARDYGTSVNTLTQLRRAAQALRQSTTIGKTVPRYKGYLVAECFGPFAWHIKNGVVVAGAFPDHADHLHVALTP